MKKFSKLLLATTLVAALLMMIWGGTAGSAKAAKIDYRKPSENKPYPDVQKNPGMWIHVNLKKQRVYLMSNKNKKLYTMYCSSGAHNATPTGTYHIEDVRGGYLLQPRGKGGSQLLRGLEGKRLPLPLCSN